MKHIIQPSQDVLDAAHDAERAIWDLSTYAGTSPNDREKIIAEFFAGFEKSRLREIIESAIKSYRYAASTRINDKDGAFWQNSFADDLERILKESRGEE